MRQRHTFCGIRDQIAGHQRILHTDMPHGNAVTDRDRRKHHRYAACLRHAKLYGVHDFIQIHMSWHNLVVGTDNTHHGLLHLLLRKSESIKQTSVGRLLGTRFHIVTSHCLFLLYAHSVFIYFVQTG